MTMDDILMWNQCYEMFNGIIKGGNKSGEDCTWYIFEPTSMWPNFPFGQLFSWIGKLMTNDDFLGIKELILINLCSDSNLT